MPVDITPLPNLPPGVDAPILKPPTWGQLPSPLTGKLAVHPLSTSLPPLSHAETAAPPVIQPSRLTPVPSATASGPPPREAPAAFPQGRIIHPEQAEFTDAVLIKAFAPIVENTVHTKQNLVDTDLEFALRRSEDRVHDQFQQQDPALLYTLPPARLDHSSGLPSARRTMDGTGNGLSTSKSSNRFSNHGRVAETFSTTSACSPLLPVVR